MQLLVASLLSRDIKSILSISVIILGEIPMMHGTLKRMLWYMFMDPIFSILTMKQCGIMSTSMQR
ncbi:hypothetical protein D364_12700 [Klebsiella pneumoniae CG43]|nr:hypothetical protein D364_12700 [Klebsiella pneumoniae CG43]